MFSLIVTLISIVLVASLAAAAMYYGGTSWTSGGTSAEVSRLTNEAAQVQAAALAYRASTGGQADGVLTLVSDDYLRTDMSASGWEVYDNAIAVSGLEEPLCLALNEKQGISGIPQCSEVGDDLDTVCCEIL